MNISHALRLLVRGPRACFRRPEFVDDLVSYDAMPPASARQFLHAACASANARITLRSIEVLNSIQWAICELSTKRGQRRATVLDDVAYILNADVAGSDTVLQMIAQQLSEGTTRLYLGLADFAAEVSILRPDEQLATVCETLDLGWMPFDLHGQPRRMRYFRALLNEGVIDCDVSDQLLIS